MMDEKDTGQHFDVWFFCFYARVKELDPNGARLYAKRGRMVHVVRKFDVFSIQFVAVVRQGAIESLNCKRSCVMLAPVAQCNIIG